MNEGSAGCFPYEQLAIADCRRLVVEFVGRKRRLASTWWKTWASSFCLSQPHAAVANFGEQTLPKSKLTNGRRALASCFTCSFPGNREHYFDGQGRLIHLCCLGLEGRHNVVGWEAQRFRKHLLLLTSGVGSGSVTSCFGLNNEWLAHVLIVSELQCVFHLEPNPFFYKQKNISCEFPNSFSIELL